MNKGNSQNSSINSYWITKIDEFIKIKNDWDDALKLSEADRPYLLSDLIITWWSVYNKGKKLRIFIVKNKQGEIVAGFPLYIMRTKITKGKFRRLSQIGDGFANYTEPFCLLDFVEFKQIFFHAVNRLKSWDFMELANIKIDFLHLENSETEKLNFNFLLQNDTSPSIIINSNADDYLKSRSKKLQQNVKYYRKKAEKIGSIFLEKITDPKEITSIADLYIKFSIDSRKGRRNSVYESSRDADFVKKIVKSFAIKNLVDAHVLYFGSEKVAVAIGWRYGQGYKYILPSYNVEFSKYSPGYSLIYELINFAYQNNDHYFDMFTGGKVEYKVKWCNSFPKIYKLTLFKKTIIGFFAYYFFVLKKQLKP